MANDKHIIFCRTFRNTVNIGGNVVLVICSVVGVQSKSAYHVIKKNTIGDIFAI